MDSKLELVASPRFGSWSRASGILREQVGSDVVPTMRVSDENGIVELTPPVPRRSTIGNGITNARLGAARPPARRFGHRTQRTPSSSSEG